LVVGYVHFALKQLLQTAKGFCLEGMHAVLRVLAVGKCPDAKDFERGRNAQDIRVYGAHRVFTRRGIDEFQCGRDGGIEGVIGRKRGVRTEPWLGAVGIWIRGVRKETLG
jgi:hypothetical protein